MSPNPSTHQPRNTNAFYAQAALSFGIALVTMIWSIFYLPVDIWIRGFLGIGTLWLTTSAFTLAKCVRDAQEDQQENRLDLERLERLERLLAQQESYGRSV
jgi:hypothetical protein